MTIDADIQGFEPGALVEMFVLDATSLGGSTYRFHPGVGFTGLDLVWQGNTYTKYPVQLDGLEWSSQGAISRPTITASNVTGLMSSLVLAYSDLVGASLTRKMTLARYLDAVNYVGGVNPSADATAYFPDETWEVVRKVKESKNAATFELAPSFDAEGVRLPRRFIIQNVCPHVYRDANTCTYAGGAVAKADDTPTADINQDVCGKRLASCKLRFGATGELFFGAFPAVGLVKA